MPATHDEEFKRLSALCRMHLKAGMLDWYAFDLKSMAALLGREGKHTDKLKVLMVAFYIDLSGVGMAPFIDDALVASLEEAARQSGLNTRRNGRKPIDLARKSCRIVGAGSEKGHFALALATGTVISPHQNVVQIV